VLADPVALDRWSDREADLIGAEEGAVRDAVRDRLQIGLGRGEQLLALAGALRADQGVAAHDQPLAGELGDVGDLPQVLLVKQRGLKDPRTGEFLDRRGFQRGDPVDPVSLLEQLDVRLGDQSYDPRRARSARDGTGPSAS
jgi:hypothetical protein